MLWKALIKWQLLLHSNSLAEFFVCFVCRGHREETGKWREDVVGWAWDVKVKGQRIMCFKHMYNTKIYCYSLKLSYPTGDHDPLGDYGVIMGLSAVFVWSLILWLRKKNENVLKVQ